VAGFDRNQWPTSIGIGGRIASESVAGFDRNPHFLNWTGGDLLSARAHLDQSLEIHRRLLAQDPKNTGGQLEAAVVLVTLGVVRMQLGDLSRALAADQEGLTIQREIARKGPNNTQVQRDMSLLLTTMGNLKKQKGDLTGALAHFEESLALRANSRRKTNIVCRSRVISAALSARSAL
jgi:tetratricopeptide (TPR) repeat protein